MMSFTTSKTSEEDRLFHQPLLLKGLQTLVLSILCGLMMVAVSMSWEIKQFNNPTAVLQRQTVRRLESLELSQKASTHKETLIDTVMLISYFEKEPRYVETIEYFFTVGVSSDDPVHYIVVVNGDDFTAKVPDYPNVEVLRKENSCYDFGSYGWAIENTTGILGLIQKYKYFLFMNCSVRGPFVPKYWPRSIHWSRIFTQRLNDDVRLVSPSLACLPDSDQFSRLYGQVPILEGYFVAMDGVALQVAWDNNVLGCHDDHASAVLDGEYMLSKVVLDAGHNIDSLLLKYGDIDWRNPANYGCNMNNHPTRYGTYDSSLNVPRKFIHCTAFDGFSVHPLEVVFHKTTWTDVTHPVEEQLTAKYTQWGMNVAAAAAATTGSTATAAAEANNHQNGA